DYYCGECHTIDGQYDLF
nr:immunoglobulin light chain junction region [Macaca mulatta]